MIFIILGVNEMQTVANKRGYHVQTQIEINTASFNRLEEYYLLSKAAIKHQLYVKAPEYYLLSHLRPKDGSPAGQAQSLYSSQYNSIKMSTKILEERNSISAAAEKVQMIHDRFAHKDFTKKKF